MGLAAAGVSALGGVTQAIIGGKQASKAQAAIDNYKRQDLKNAYEDLEVSTMGADLQKEQLTTAAATGVQALQTGGARTLIGGIGKVQEQVVSQARQIGADLDVQKRENQMAEAQGEMQVQQMTERREEQDLAGLGQQLATGQQNMMSGIAGFASSVGSFGRMAFMKENPDLFKSA